jgi:hypothetical protein
VSLFSRLLRRFVTRARQRAAPARSVEAREQRLAERFLEDEALRGELEDDAWQPVQDWLLGQVKQLAASTAGLDDSSAQAVLDDAETRLRDAAAQRVSALSRRGAVIENTADE